MVYYAPAVCELVDFVGLVNVGVPGYVQSAEESRGFAFVKKSGARTSFGLEWARNSFVVSLTHASEKKPLNYADPQNYTLTYRHRGVQVGSVGESGLVWVFFVKGPRTW